MSATTTEKKSKKGKKDGAQISTKFTPKFWLQADGRCSAVKMIRHLVDEFKEHSGADSIMKQVLCERAAFLTVQLATYELDAAAGKEYPVGVYTQMSNALSGILTKLGLDKKETPTVIDLKSYMKDKKR